MKVQLDENNYFDGTITDNGYEFLHNHPLNYYEEFNLSFVDYSDFEKYFYEQWNELVKTVFSADF